MAELFYQIEETTAKNERYLLIKIFSKGEAGRVLYRDVLLYLAKDKDKKALDFLVLQQCKFLGISLQGPQISKVSFSQIHVSKEQSIEAIKHLAPTGQLFWKGKKLIVDPFSLIQVSYEVEERENASLFVKPLLSLMGKEMVIKEGSFFFPGSTPWIIQDGIWYSFDPSSELSYLSKISLQGELLEGRFAKRFLEDFVDETTLVWKRGKKEETSLQIQPYLVIHDKYGAFANLWMEYSNGAKIASHDPSPYSYRDRKKELEWEKDLVESGYQKKLMDRTSYYCPVDKASSTLQFLLEIGWKVMDSQERRVLLPGERSSFLEMNKDLLYIKGKIKYGEFEADISSVVQGIAKKERFIDLGGGAVGLLDTKEILLEYSPLLAEKEEGDELVFKKSKFALLESFFGSANQEERISYLAKALRSSSEIVETLPSDLFKAKLYPYQQEGVNWLSFLERMGFHGLLADEMGLGKTVQLIAFISLLESTSPILLVMPTSLLFHWKKEFEKFLPSKEIYVHSGSLRLSNVEELEKKSIILTSYALLRIDQPILSKISFAATILDEAQYIKNPDSKVAEAACSLKSDFRIAMTGTPIENHWQDLWSIFYYLMPSLLDPRQEFLLRTSSGDAAYIRNCKKKVQPFLKRRKKESVDLQLPPKMQQIVWVEMTDIQQSVYEEFLKKTKQGLLKQVEKEGLGACRMQILEAILRLRQICCHPLLVDPSLEGDPKVMSGKYEQLFSDLQAVYEEGHKVLVYSQFTQMLGRMRKDIEERGWKYVYLDGSVKNREELVETFQEDPETKIFLLSLKAGGVGLNLTAAEYVFFYDPWWNEAVENQAIDRAHRLGQQKKVIARRYVTAQSIEEKIMKIKEHKKSMSDTLFDDAMSMQALSLQEWYELFTM